MLEGELQAREIVIAVLKSEQIKKLLNPSKLPLTTSGFKSVKNLNSFGSKTFDLNPDQTIKYSTDPLTSLSRDSFAVYEPSFDYSTTLALYNLKVYQLENFIKNQKTLHNNLNDQLKTFEQRYEKIINDLEVERSKNIELESKFQQYDKAKLDDEIKTLTQTIEDNKTREKQIILSLLTERKHLIIKLIEERHQNEELRQILTSEKGKIAEMVEGLEDESKRSLQMEAELEKYLSDFDKERNSYQVQLQISETKNSELLKEIEQLRNSVDNLQKQLLAGVKITESIDSTKWNIGEGVRSSIVTMPVSSKVHSLSSVSTVSHPKASVAQPVTKSISSTNTILPPPSIPVPQPKQNIASLKKVSANQISSQTINVDNVHVISKPLNDSISFSENVDTEISKNSDNSVKQNIMFYENSAHQSKPSVSITQGTTIIRKSSTGARVPPPVPPNKPSIKPVLPSQAILNKQVSQNKLKDVNNSLIKTNSQSKSCINSNTSSISKS